MRKILFIAALFMMVMFTALNCAAQDQDLQTFTLKIDGREAMVNLPKEVPDMKDAKHTQERCFDAYLCVDHYAINEKETLVISFWHHKGAIIGFVLHYFSQDTLEWKHTAWLYAGDTPSWATADEFNDKLMELYQGAE